MGSAERIFRRRFPAQPARLKEIRAAVREAAEGCGCAPGCSADIVMAVDEACQNIIRHGYGGDPQGAIVLEIQRDGDCLIVSLQDFAPAVDPERVRPRDLDDLRPGGLGIHLMHEVMDECAFVDPPAGGGNLLRMVKRIR